MLSNVDPIVVITIAFISGLPALIAASTAAWLSWHNRNMAAETKEILTKKILPKLDDPK